MKDELADFEPIAIVTLEEVNRQISVLNVRDTLVFAAAESKSLVADLWRWILTVSVEKLSEELCEDVFLTTFFLLRVPGTCL